jgi:hypothetical protein
VSPVEANIETKRAIKNPRMPFLKIFSEKNNENFSEKILKFFDDSSLGQVLCISYTVYGSFHGNILDDFRLLKGKILSQMSKKREKSNFFHFEIGFPKKNKSKFSESCHTSSLRPCL